MLKWQSFSCLPSSSWWLYFHPSGQWIPEVLILLQRRSGPLWNRNCFLSETYGVVLGI